MKEIWNDALLILGLALLAVGLWQIYPPAAAIFVGAVLVSVSLSRTSNEEDRRQ